MRGGKWELMRDRPADGAQRPGPAGGPPGGPAGGAVPDRWQQRAGFSVFFDTQPGGPGELRRRTRLYHEETGDETTFPDSGRTDWVRWMLDRLGSAQPPSEPAGGPASVVSMEIIDVRLAEDPMPGADDDSVGVELRLRVTGMAELHRALGARVAGVVFGPGRR
jgi:hypothetical protein